MEASQAGLEHEEVVQGESGEDRMEEGSTEAQEPLGTQDQHGTVQPKSAPPPQSLSGEGVTPDPVKNPPNTMTGA